MPTGIVKWFNNAKGFGFIKSEQIQEDIFAHYSAIKMDGFKTLKTDQAVKFDIERGEKGFHAINIRIDTAPQSQLTHKTSSQPIKSTEETLS